MSILALLLGRCLCDRYRVDSVIATGGMGAVCRAFDLKLERLVAVKVITAHAPDPEEAGLLRARFHREARAAARLRHPNVVTMHDFGTDPGMGIDFLVMELLAGEDLAARMRRAGGPLPVEEAVEILREAGMGLAAGHRAGMVHRDVKPGNIYLVAEPGGWEVKVLDFGIAQVRAEASAETDVRLTRFGAPHTPRYASPEQLQGGERLGPASDVYSLALTGLEMLGGQHPEGLNSSGDDRAAARAVRRLLQQRPEVPLRLAAVLRRALRLAPEARFAHADAFLDALEEWDEAPPNASAAAQGYASILPGAPVPRPAPQDDDRTMLAPPFAERAHPPPPGWLPPAAAPLVPVAAAAVPQNAPTAEAAGETAVPAASGTPPARGRRRMRIKAAGWLLLAALGVASGAWLATRQGTPDVAGPVRHVGIEPVVQGPAGGPGLAQSEFERVRNGGLKPGDAAYLVIIASLRPEQMELAGQLQQRILRKGYDVGLANSSVYPELRDGFVVLVSRPRPSREEAEAELPDLRRDGAPDAFVKRVTLRRP